MNNPVTKRIIPLALCLALFFTIVPSAFAAHGISFVAVSVTEPTEGVAPLRREETSDMGFFYFVIWADEAGQMAAGDRFRAGGTYRCHVLAYARDGYEFSPTAEVIVNGTPAKTLVSTATRLQAYAEYTVLPLELSAEVSAPVAGTHPDMTARAGGETYTAEINGWFRGGDIYSPGIRMGQTDYFEGGETYYVETAFIPANGATFPMEAPTAFIGDQRALFSGRRPGDGALLYRAEYVLPTAFAAVRVTAPAAGEKPQENGSVSGRGVALSGGVRWLSGNTRLGASDVFEPGMDYTCVVTLVPQDGTAFSGDMKVTINGNLASPGEAENGQKTFRYLFTVPNCKAPAVKTAEQVGNGVKITWDAVPGVAKYAIYRKNGTEYERISLREGTSYIDPSPVSGKRNDYAVCCVNSAGKTVSPLGTPGGTMYYGLKAPTLAEPMRTNNGLSLSWTAVSGASRYAVYRRIGENGQWQRYTIVSGTSYLDRGVENGVRYYYTVSCLGDDGTPQSKESESRNKIYYKLDEPVITGADNADKGIRITWKAVPGAAKYAVYRKTETDGSWTRYTITTATSYLDRGVENGVRYEYSVRCMDSGDQIVSGIESSRALTYYALNAPSFRAAGRVDGGIRLTWTADRGAARYAVYRRLGDEDAWTRYTVTSDTSYTDRNVENGVEYRYMIRCLDATGTLISPATTGQSVTYYRLTPPNIESILWTPQGVRITWSPVSGVSGYIIMRKDSRSDWREIAYSSSTIFLDPNVVAGGSYSYAVICVDRAGVQISDYDHRGANIVLN